MSHGLSWFLLEDDDLVSASISRRLQRAGRVERVSTCSEARAALDDVQRFCGIILDVRLPDGSGLDILREIRKQDADVPVLVLTAVDDHETISEAQLHGAQYLPKPFGNQNLDAFILTGIRAWRPERQFLLEIEEYASRHRLSARETEALRLIAAGASTTALTRLMEIKASTVKTIVRRILRKTNANRIGDIAREIQWKILGRYVEDPQK